MLSRGAESVRHALNASRALGHARRCFNLLRFDVLLDTQLDVHLLEVNVLPNLYHTPGLYRPRAFLASALQLLGVDGFDRSCVQPQVAQLQEECRANRPGRCPLESSEALRELDEEAHRGVWQRVV